MTQPILRIKVDEDLPPIIADLLRERGYEASTVVEQQMGGYKDGQLWKAIQTEGKFLVTADKGLRTSMIIHKEHMQVCSYYTLMKMVYVPC